MSGNDLRRAILRPNPACPSLRERRNNREHRHVFSLIILNKDAPEYLIPLLESLKGDDVRRCCEIIVGDTGTSDRGVLEYYRNARHAKVVRGLNYHFGRNYNDLISKHANGEFLGLMNNDIILTDTSFLRKIERILSDSKIGIAGSKLLYPNGKLQHGGIFFLEDGPRKGLPYHRLHGRDPRRLPEKPQELVPAATGAFLFCRRDDFARCGGFDENYKEEAQDVDLCLKLRRIGKEVVFMNLDGIVHIENGTRPKGSENPRDRAYFLWKWGSFLEATILGSGLNAPGVRIHP